MASFWTGERIRLRGVERATAAPDGDRFQLPVEAVDTGELAGAVGSYHTDPRAGWFEYGITIGADHRRNDYAAGARA